MTRQGNYDLAKINTSTRKRSDLGNRAKMINDSNCNMYISIHLNSISSSYWSGAQIFYDDINVENEKIAQILQQQLKNDLKTTREYKQMKDMYMYKQINVPGVLAEVGFLSNENDRYLLQTEEYQNKIVQSLFEGIKKYFHS